MRIADVTASERYLEATTQRLSALGKSKSVAHYYGCGNSGALGKLTALENKIDEVAGSQKWIK